MNRTFWHGWCAFWLLAWITIGWLLFPFNLLMAALSVGAFFIPVGKESYKTIRHDANYRPAIPSSRYDTRFTEDELRRHFDEN